MRWAEPKPPNSEKRTQLYVYTYEFILRCLISETALAFPRHLIFWGPLNKLVTFTQWWYIIYLQHFIYSTRRLGNCRRAPFVLHTHKHPVDGGAGYTPWGRKESDTTEQLHFTKRKYENKRSCWSVTKSCPSLCNPMDCSMLGLLSKYTEILISALVQILMFLEDNSYLDS